MRESALQAMGEERPISVDMLSDSGSGITAIPEVSLKEVQAGVKVIKRIRPFEEKARVVTATGD